MAQVLPKFEHTYSYPCTFLGTQNIEGKEYDMYHTKTFQGVLLLCRFGNNSLDFDAEDAKRVKSSKDDSDYIFAKPYRVAEEMKLELE